MASIRDTPAGEFLRFVGFKARLRFPEEIPGKILPSPRPNDLEKQARGSGSDSDSSDATLTNGTAIDGLNTVPKEELVNNESADMSNIITKTEKKDPEITLVDWYDNGDMANPRNWSAGRKAWVTLAIWYASAVGPRIRKLIRG